MKSKSISGEVTSPPDGSAESNKYENVLFSYLLALSGVLAESFVSLMSMSVFLYNIAGEGKDIGEFVNNELDVEG